MISLHEVARGCGVVSYGSVLYSDSLALIVRHRGRLSERPASNRYQDPWMSASKKVLKKQLLIFLYAPQISGLSSCYYTLPHLDREVDIRKFQLQGTITIHDSSNESSWSCPTLTVANQATLAYDSWFLSNENRYTIPCRHGFEVPRFEGSISGADTASLKAQR